VFIGAGAYLVSGGQMKSILMITALQLISARDDSAINDCERRR